MRYEKRDTYIVITVIIFRRLDVVVPDTESVAVIVFCDGFNLAREVFKLSRRLREMAL
jgi:hypothetical protein